MAKYTTTSMDFFLKLGLEEGMAYFMDIAEMANEEVEQLQPRTVPTLPDTSAWPSGMASP